MTALLVSIFPVALKTGQLPMLQTEIRHVIVVLDVLPVACAMRLWSVNALHCRVIYFIDNDSAGACLIKMSSGSAVINSVLRRVTIMSAASPSFAWYSRVPSASNVADEPSRMAPLLLMQNESMRVIAALESCQ